MVSSFSSLVSSDYVCRVAQLIRLPAGCTQPLAEIRACQEELQTFLAETFDRLDEVVGRLRRQGPAAHTERHADPNTMQDQIDHLTQLVSDLARTVKAGE